MARQRRGGGFRPPEIRGTLGTLLRTTLEQAGFVRDALERGARSGRSRLDEALSGRRRKDALAELGELVLDLIRRGEIDLGELPEARELVQYLDEIDADAERGGGGGGGGGGAGGGGGDFEDADDRVAKPPTRRRFDERSRDRDADRDDEDAGYFDDRERDRDDRDDRNRADRERADRARRGERPNPRGSTSSSGSGSRDGTVSALSGARRPSPSKPAAPPRVWRPTLPDDPPSPAEEPRRARALPRDPHRKGGISFDDDDLADYMHPDDVPPKPPSDDDH